MKRKKKPVKIYAALTMGIFLAICGISGCGREGSDSENAEKTIEASGDQAGKKEYDLASGSWTLDEETEISTESWPIADYFVDYELRVSQEGMRLSKRISAVDGCRYYVLERYMNGNVGPGCQKYYLTCLDMESLKTEKKELTLQETSAGGENELPALAKDLDENWLIITGMSVTDGKICLLALQMSREEKVPAHYYVIWLNGEGRIESAVDLLPEIQQAGMQQGNVVPEGILYDESGYYYVGMENGVSGIGVFDKEGRYRKHVEAPYDGSGTIYLTCCLPDGRPVFECAGSDRKKTILFCLEDLKEKILYYGECDMASVRYLDSSGEVFYAGGRGILRWNVETGKQERIYQDTSMNPWFYEALWKTQDGGITAVSYDGEYTFAQKLMSGTEAGEKKVTLFMLSEDQFIRICADEYSRLHPGIKIEIKTLGADEEYDTAFQRFAAQLISGEGPDMFVMRREQLEILQAKGALAELTQFLPKEVLGQVFPVVLETGTVDGKLYGIATRCYVKTLAVSESLWQGKTWDYPDIVSLMEAGEASGDGPKSILGDGYSSEKLLDILALVSMGAGKSSLVDEKAGKCYFDTDEFVGLLEFCKKYGRESGRDMSGEEMIHSCSGDLAGFSMSMAELGEGYHRVGYPVNSDSGGFVECWFLVGVNDKTDHEEIVRDFLQYLLSERKQSMGRYALASVRKDVLCGGVMEHSAYSESAVYVDAAGACWELASKPDGSSFLSEYLEALENAAPLPLWHEQIEGVVLEESRAYFEGDKTAQDVAAIIQNRVQLYLDER